MPGSVANAAASTVFPWELASSFTRVWDWALIEAIYADGHSERDKLVASSRRKWLLSHRLTDAELGTLRTFFIARKGIHEPFIFYDIYETSPIFTFDLTGVASAGKYVARFGSPLDIGWGFARSDVPLEIVEIN